MQTQARAAGLLLVGWILAGSHTTLAQSDVETLRQRLVGVYELAEYAPHGDEPSGRIWYAPNGQMSAMLFQPGRAPVANSASDAEFRASMRGVVAYYGTYTIDTDAGTVTHHVMGASNPAWIGDDFVRWYRFEGDDLRLSLNSRFENTLFWRRLPQ